MGNSYNPFGANQFRLPNNNLPMQSANPFGVNGNNFYIPPPKQMGYDSVSFGNQQLEQQPSFLDKLGTFFTKHGSSILKIGGSLLGIGLGVGLVKSFIDADVDYDADECPKEATSWIAKGKYHICHFLRTKVGCIDEYQSPTKKSSDETPEEIPAAKAKAAEEEKEKEVKPAKTPAKEPAEELK